MVNENELLIRSLKMFVNRAFSNFVIKTARQYILHNFFITTHIGAAVKLRESEITSLILTIVLY